MPNVQGTVSYACSNQYTCSYYPHPRPGTQPQHTCMHADGSDPVSEQYPAQQAVITQ